MSGHDLTAELETLLPLAVAWAERQAKALQREGTELSVVDQDLARSVGVEHPDRVRVRLVTRIPAPSDPRLSRACVRLGFLGPDTVGLTLGYGVYLRSRITGRRRVLLAHELRHVAQYERYGSIEAYLGVYIPDLLRHGYQRAPLEVDARAAEEQAR